MSHKAFISLESTVFDFGLLVAEAFNRPSMQVLDPKGRGLVKLPDFGVVVVGWDSLPLADARWKDDIAGWLFDEAPVMSAPGSWRLPQILRAIGAFKSAGEAARNGWNLDVPEGLSQHTLRLCKVKGVLSVFRIPALLAHQTFR